MEAKSILLERNQTCWNQFYASRINFEPSRSGTKHTLTTWMYMLISINSTGYLMKTTYYRLYENRLTLFLYMIW